MKKQQFLAELWKRLSDVPKEDVERSLDYYSEMIDDRVEAGMSEEEAVADIGSVEEAAKQIIAEAPKHKAAAGRSAAAQQTGAGRGYTAGTDAYYSAPRDNVGSMGYTGSSAKHSAVYHEAYEEAMAEHLNGGAAPRKNSSGGMSAGKVVALILLFPIWFPLVITLGALLFAAFVTIWALTISFFAVAGAFVASGVAGVLTLIFYVFSGQVAAGFFHLGAGLLLAGIGILMFMIAGGIVKATARGSRGILRAVTGIFRRREAV